MKNANLPILLVVIVAVAITAQLTRQSGEKPEWQRLRSDMVSSLTQLWGQEGHRIELVPTAKGVDAQVTVSMPGGLRLRQQRWNYPFLRFVAARHPAVGMQNLFVLENGSKRPIPEVAMVGLIADRVAPRANFEDEEERVCQLATRQLSSALDRKLGPGHGIVLVDAQLSRSSRQSRRFGNPDPQALAFAKIYPSKPRVMVTEIRVVVDRDLPVRDLDQILYGYSGGVNLRVITLP